MLGVRSGGTGECTGRIKDARAVYERLLGIDKRNPALFVKLGILASHQGDFHVAISYFERAVKHDPSSAHIRNNLATVLIQIGRLDQAREHALQALKANGNSVQTLRILFDCSKRQAGVSW